MTCRYIRFNLHVIAEALNQIQHQMPKVDAVAETSTPNKLLVPGSQDISNVVPEPPVGIDNRPQSAYWF